MEDTQKVSGTGCNCGRNPHMMRLTHSETCALMVAQQEKALREREPHPGCTHERECPVHPLGHWQDGQHKFVAGETYDQDPYCYHLSGW